MSRKPLLLFAIAATGSFVLSSTGEADAAWRRQGPSFCHLYGSTNFRNNYGEIENRSTSTTLELECPVIDDSFLPKGSLTTLNLHGADNHSNASARSMACVTYYPTVGGECGPWAVSGDAMVGQYVLTPSRTAWSAEFHEGDFGYILVSLPAMTGSSPSTFRGYYSAN